MAVSVRFAGFVVAAVVIPAVHGCAPAAGEVTREQRQAIVGGRDSDASQDAVVLLETESNGVFIGCTGTLVAPNLVISARHCVTQGGLTNVICDENGTPLAGNGEIGVDVAAEKITVYTGANRRDAGVGAGDEDARGKKLFHSDARAFCSNDVVAILLDRSIAKAVVAPIRLQSKPRAGEHVDVVGWGITRTERFPKVRQQRNDLVIDRVGPRVGNSTEFALPANDFEIGEVTSAGDSGGPAFSTTSGALLGVTSRGGGGAPATELDPSAACVGATRWNAFTAVAPFEAKIREAFAESGFEPVLDTRPPPPEEAPDAAADAAPSDLAPDAAATPKAIATPPDTTRSPTNVLTPHDEEGPSGAPPKSASCAASPASPSLDAAFALLAAAMLALARRRAHSHRTRYARFMSSQSDGTSMT